MAMYRPTQPFTTGLMLLVPKYQKISGVRKKVYPKIEDGIMFRGSFKTYGGTERDVNGVLVVEDTADIETWFFPEVKSECRVGVITTGAIYDIMGEPENIDMRNQFLKFKVKRVKGGA